MNFEAKIRITGTLTLRGVKLFFRDKSSVVTSILGVLIVLAIYIGILKNSLVSGFDGYPNANVMADAWLISGLLGIIPISSSVAAMSLIIKDKTMGVLGDFKTAPISTLSITAGYILSTFVIGMIMSLTFLLLTDLYMISSGFGFSAVAIMQATALLIPSVFSSCAIIFFFTALLKTKASFDGFSMLINILIGFVTGTFIPLGYYSKSIQNILNMLPANHSASIFRDILGTPTLNNTFAGTSEIQTNRDLLGFDIYIREWMATPEFGILYLIVSGIVFFILAAIMMRKIG